MAPGYGISSIGSYANDPYFLYALNSYNPNFTSSMSANTSVSTPASNEVNPYIETSSSASASASTTNTNTAGNTTPSFKGSDKGEADDGIGAGKLVAGGLMVAGGALACIKAYKRGDGTGLKKMFDGFKQYGQKFLGTSAKEAAEKTVSKADDAAAKMSNIIKNGGDNIQKYTIEKDGMQFVIEGGNLSQIITKDKKVITDITKWKQKYSALWNKINNFSIGTGNLPKNVKFDSVARTITDNGKTYRVILNKEGKISNVYSVGKNNQLSNIDNLDEFLAKRTDFAKKAETFEHTTKAPIALFDSNNNYRSQMRDVTITTRNGEFVSARYKDGNSWVDIEDATTLKKLKESTTDVIGKIGSWRGYGVEPKDCLYSYTENGKTVRFFGDKRPLEMTTEKPLTSTKEVNQFFNNNGNLKNELDNIISTGNVPSGFRVGNMTYKSNSGVVYEIADGKIKGIRLDHDIKLGSKNIPKETLIKGNELNEWKKKAANNSSYQKVYDLLNN